MNELAAVLVDTYTGCQMHPKRHKQMLRTGYSARATLNNPPPLFRAPHTLPDCLDLVSQVLSGADDF